MIASFCHIRMPERPRTKIETGPPKSVGRSRSIVHPLQPKSHDRSTLLSFWLTISKHEIIFTNAIPSLRIVPAQGKDMALNINNNQFEQFLFIAFILVFIPLGLLGAYFFHFNRDAAFKKKWFPPYVILVGVVFGSYVAATTLISAKAGQGWFPLFIFMPGIAAISYLNIKLTHFCTSCGKTHLHQSLFSKAKNCPYCGGKFNKEEV